MNDIRQIPVPSLRGLVACVVDGDGFAPALRDGEFVVIDPERRRADRPGRFVCRRSHSSDAVTLRWLEPVPGQPGKLLVRSVKDVRGGTVVDADDVPIVGRVRWSVHDCPEATAAAEAVR